MLELPSDDHARLQGRADRRVTGGVAHCAGTLTLAAWRLDRRHGAAESD